MYCSLLGIYITPAGMNARERTRRQNIFPITLGPFGSSFDDIIGALYYLSRLDYGVHLEINGTEKFVCGFVMAFTRDMAASQGFKGLISAIADYGCGFCLAHKSQRVNLDFNIIKNGRYHYQTINLRRQSEMLSNKSQRLKFFQKIGMAPQQTPLIKIAPCLDIIRSRPGDAAHSEYAGLAKQAQSLLFDAILNKKGQEAYVKELQSQPLPPGWARLQSPMYHLKSYRMSECARISVLTPLILRRWLREGFIEANYLRAVRVTLTLPPIDAITKCFALMAQSSAVILSPSMSGEDRDQMHYIIKKGRKAFQNLFRCASLAAARDKRRTTTPANSSIASSQASSVLDIEEDDDGEKVKRSKKEKVFKTFLSRLNVHTGLHYWEVAHKYITP